MRAVRIGLMAVALAGAPVLAEEAIPPNDGWVTDLAGFLEPQQEQSLEQLMESYKVGSSNEIALLTVPTLGGRSLEQYALETARTWGMGEQGKNNAALLLVAREERKIRIEVGRGLEGNLTDSISGRIIRNVISPRFKRGEYYEGLRDGIVAMHAAAGGDYGSIPRDRGSSGSKFNLFYLFFVLFVIMNLLRGARGGRGGRGGLLPWLILGGLASGRGHRGSSGWHGGSSGGFGGFGGGGGFSGGGSSGGW